jgi:hypothetical protein
MLIFTTGELSKTTLNQAVKFSPRVQEWQPLSKPCGIMSHLTMIAKSWSWNAKKCYWATSWMNIEIKKHGTHCVTSRSYSIYIYIYPTRVFLLCMIQTLETGMNFLTVHCCLCMLVTASRKVRTICMILSFAIGLPPNHHNKESHFCVARFYQVFCKYYSGLNANLGQK